MKQKVRDTIEDVLKDYNGPDLDIAQWYMSALYYADFLDNKEITTTDALNILKHISASITDQNLANAIMNFVIDYINKN